MWCVYLLICSDGSIYTGITNDINRRLLTHNKGKGAKYTRSRLPVQLAALFEVETKEEALREECRIKKLTRNQKIDLIRLHSNGLYFGDI